MRKNKEGLYIIDSLEKLKEWYKMTDLTHSEKLKEKALFYKELNKIKQKSIDKQKNNK